MNYDETGDVLYVSLGESQPAISFEVDTDILLRYVPPSYNVVGITIMNFLMHFPCVSSATFESHAAKVVAEFLKKYPKVPM
ncbi:MAG: DUF2283 domain-containing protein [Candidatus Tectomicrobia bacterium]|nr:DUF2283 domain-containing protein [Candidatus Tectomicrobia bacterium]